MGQTREHGPMYRRIGNNWKVEQSGLRVTWRNEERIGDPIPVRRGTAVEVDINLGVEVGVEAEVRVRRVKAGETAVAEDRLRPRYRRAGCLERAVVLRSALHVLRVRRVHRQALELQGLQALVQACPCRRGAGQELLAASEADRIKPTSAAAGRDVCERAIRAHQTTV